MSATDLPKASFLAEPLPPMGIYETLYKFKDTFGQFMGTNQPKPTHPWSQGFPLTTPLTKFDGPELPASVEVTWEDRFYPKAWGHPELRQTIADYYNKYYCPNGGKSPIDPDNVMIFAGGRPGIYTVLAFLNKEVEIRIANIEWPAYLDIMEATDIRWTTVDCNAENGFHPSNESYFKRNGLNAKARIFPIISNPSNPTGHARAGKELEELVAMAESDPRNGLMLDEAYEMFHNPAVSGLQYVKNLDESNIFLTGACTKGLQCPGIRIGWMIASKTNIDKLSAFSSFGMGGVSHPSQLYAVKLLEPERAAKQRKAIQEHYQWQRDRYRKAFEDMGLIVHTGEGGFYHWLELPQEWGKTVNCITLNEKLFLRGAAILEGQQCDMGRPWCKEQLKCYTSPYLRFFRFSFGPLLPETFEGDIKIMRETIEDYRKELKAQM